MTKREIANLAFKILAAYLTVRGTVYLGSVIAFPFMIVRSLGVADLVTATNYLAPSAGQIALGLLLWFNSWKLASAAVRDDGTPVGPPASRQQWMTAAFALIGISVLAGAIPEVAAAAEYLIRMRDVPGFEEYKAMASLPERMGNIVGFITGVAIGLGLLFGAHRLTLWVDRTLPSDAADDDLARPEERL